VKNNCTERKGAKVTILTFVKQKTKRKERTKQNKKTATNYKEHQF